MRVRATMSALVDKGEEEKRNERSIRRGYTRGGGVKERGDHEYLK